MPILCVQIILARLRFRPIFSAVEGLEPLPAISIPAAKSTPCGAYDVWQGSDASFHPLPPHGAAYAKDEGRVYAPCTVP